MPNERIHNSYVALMAAISDGQIYSEGTLPVRFQVMGGGILSELSLPQMVSHRNLSPLLFSILLHPPIPTPPPPLFQIFDTLFVIAGMIWRLRAHNPITGTPRAKLGLKHSHALHCSRL